MYPTKMEANGHIYPINTDYRVALACFRALDDDEITDLERFYAVETLLLGSDVLEEDEMILKDKIALYLKCEREDETSDNEIDFDYLQDENRVKISIRQCYNNLDIDKMEYLHWYEYNELIEGLTEDSLIDRVRQIRGLDTNEIEDKKKRMKAIEIKKRLALHKKVKLTEEQAQAQEEFFRLLNGGDKDE